MSSATLASFAGSIGGVASAASALASLLTGPAANSWWGSLRQASYGGVPFAVLESRTRFGGRNVVHMYPFRDDAWIEPMGKLPRQFEIIGFLIENSLVYGGGSVIAQRDRLIAACEANSAQTLVHPTFGSIQNVACLASEASESVEHGRVIMVRFVFMRGGTRIYPNVSTSTTSLIESAAGDLCSSSLIDFATATAAAIQEGAAVVHTVVDTALSWYQTAIVAIHDVKRVFNSISTLAGNFGRFFGGGNSGYAGANQKAPAGTTAQQLLGTDTANLAAVATAGASLQTAAGSPGNTAALGSAVQSFVPTFAATAADPADGIRLLTGLASFSPTGNFTSSAIGGAMQTVQTASGALFRRTALASVATAVSAWQPASSDDAQAMMTSVAALIDAEIEIAGDAGDDASYGALRALRKAVVQDLQTRGFNLAPLVTMNFGASLPALVLAHRVYDDASRADQLVQQVQPIHPLFLPQSFVALAT